MAPLWYNIGIMKNKVEQYTGYYPVLGRIGTLPMLYLPAYEDYLDVGSCMIAGVDPEDAFDFCDAYIAEAKWRDGSNLTDAQLETIMELESVQQLVLELAGNCLGY